MLRTSFSNDGGVCPSRLPAMLATQRLQAMRNRGEVFMPGKGLLNVPD